MIFCIYLLDYKPEPKKGQKHMSDVRRVYVEKKPDFAVQAKELKHEISSYLGIKTRQGCTYLSDTMWRIFPRKYLRRHVAVYFLSRR